MASVGKLVLSMRRVPQAKAAAGALPQKHGKGAWEAICRDRSFPLLQSKSGTNLKVSRVRHPPLFCMM